MTKVQGATGTLVESPPLTDSRVENRAGRDESAFEDRPAVHGTLVPREGCVYKDT